MTDTAHPIPEAQPAPTLGPALASALKWHEADVRRLNLETLLKQTPVELASIARRVDEEKVAFEVRRKAVMELEVRRKEVDNRLKSAETQVRKYKTQQVEVRKNDEYQALTNQIAASEAEVSAIETEELQLLMQIDEARESLRAAEAESQRRLGVLENEAVHVRRREAQCQADLAAQAGAVESAAADVPLIWRRAYETVKTRVKRPPFISAIEDHRCAVCRLRVSNEVAEGARRGGKPMTCDNCGRLVYWPV
jgi:uncharacterized protein